MKSVRNWLFLTFHFSFLVFLFSCKSLSPNDGAVERLAPAASPVLVSPQWQPFAADAVGGLSYYAGKVTNPRLDFFALRIDLSSPDLRIVVSGGGAGSGGTFLSATVSSFVRNNNLLAGINALPFDVVSDREGEPRTNVGLVIANGVMVSPPHAKYDALVFFANGCVAIAAQSKIDAAAVSNAVGGFYRILEAGEPVPRVLELTARHPRSAAGISGDGGFLYLLVIDGRRIGSVGSTEAETALILKALGASDGINFDGGGSSALVLRYPDGTIRAANIPIHGQIPGRERAVAGCLGIGLLR